MTREALQKANNIESKLREYEAMQKILNSENPNLVSAIEQLHNGIYFGPDDEDRKAFVDGIKTTLTQLIEKAEKDLSDL